MSFHKDSHYCLASVKGVRQFAETFPEHSIIISQDDKAKVPLGIPAVDCTFSTVQTHNQPVSIPDHNFPVSSKHKLITSVYGRASVEKGEIDFFFKIYFIGPLC
ncbi:hypothetical protein RclHR1_14850001 [Rhizophagus clarus]|uniref:Uncharacterized protein n=1 Tax=Rhizophagus clarus TaxID=94130 RepID=A0A2Z6R677_9GLOM|nr:hypothetical protein RclHR1_14850001 [Rhizophagus clarus]